MEGLEIERRFLVRPGFSEKNLPMAFMNGEYSIWQAYLKKFSKGSGRRRIRLVIDRRKDSTAYFLTEKKPTENPMVRIENEKEINKEEFDRLQRDERDPSRDVITKVRYCFDWKGQKFELDFFFSPPRLSDLVILEIELDNPDKKVELPDFIPIAVEITNSRDLSNSNLAKRPQ